LGYRKELADFIKSAGVPTVAITLVNDEIPLPRVEGDKLNEPRKSSRPRPWLLLWAPGPSLCYSSTPMPRVPMAVRSFQ
jgi:hypothetical protein